MCCLPNLRGFVFVSYTLTTLLVQICYSYLSTWALLAHAISKTILVKQLVMLACVVYNCSMERFYSHGQHIYKFIEKKKVFS